MEVHSLWCLTGGVRFAHICLVGELFISCVGGSSISTESCVGGVSVSLVGPLAPTKFLRLMPRLSSRGGAIDTELDGVAEIDVMDAIGCCLVSRVSVGAILAPLLQEGGVVDSCGSFSFCLYVLPDTVLVSSKKPVMAELLSGISPSGP